MLLLLIFFLFVSMGFGLHDYNNKQELHTETLTRMNRAANEGRKAKSSRGQQSTSSKVEVCNDPECKELAKHILNTMDLSADPCKDFMQYSNGKWLKNVSPTYHKVLDYRSSIENLLSALLADPSKSSSKAIQFVKDLYKKCMDTTTINKQNSKPIHKFLRDVGGWPILLSNWDERSANLQRLFGKIFQWSHALISDDILQSPFTLRLSVHTENTKKYHFDFKQHETIVNVAFHTNKKHEPKINAYKKLFTKFVSLIAADMKVKVDNNQMNMDWSKVLDLERKLAALMSPMALKYNYTVFDQMPIWTLEKIASVLNIINLEKLLEDVMEPETFKKLVKGKSKTLKCMIYLHTYFPKLNELLKATDKRTLFNYFIWNFIYHSSYLIDTRFQDAVAKSCPDISTISCSTTCRVGMEIPLFSLEGCTMQKIDINELILSFQVYGVKNESLSSLCAKRCKSVGMATTALYIKKYFPPTEKAEAESMIAELKKEVKKGLPMLSWMDDATKKKALEKFGMIDSFITYPDYALTDQALDKFYDKLPMKSSDTYSNMLMAVNTFNRKNTLNMLSKPPDKRLLFDPLFMIGAFYLEQNNLIVPVGAMQPLVFSSHYPKAFNFGASGNQISMGLLSLLGQREHSNFLFEIDTNVKNMIRNVRHKQ